MLALGLLAACGGGGIEGTWKMDTATIKALYFSGGQGDESLLNGISMEVTFKGDGTYKAEMFENGKSSYSEDGKYTADGDKITMGGATFTFKIDGNKMTWTAPDGSGAFGFTRK